ncbi:tudor domain-containing protein 3-like, partial [Asbolus verrucosus]
MVCGYFIFQTRRIVLGHSYFIKYPDYNVLEASFFNSLTRVAWSLALSIIIILCVNGYGGLINSILSSKIFVVLIRLNYNIYLLHLLTILAVVAQQRTPGYFSNMVGSDLKEIGSSILTKILNKNNVSQVVLQIQKIRNISAPKANENSHVAPRMLKFTLTDGDSYIQAIETASIPSINHEKTPPGSKLLIHSAKIASGYLLLDPTNCSLLGGKVPALYEKWELAKTLSDGPPAWVNFGSKIQSDLQDTQFKSLDNKNQDSKENTKFDLQRQDAIAEATSGAVKKVFGGGMKQAVQNPVNINFKKSNEFHAKEKKPHNKIKNNTKEVEERPQKPSERVSLFDFLEDKLPANEASNNLTQNEPSKPIINNNNPSSQQNNRSRNNYSLKPTNKFETNQINAQSRPKKETKPQTPQFKSDDDIDVNGLSHSLGKMSLNSQFASRSLRQHLNLGTQKKNELEKPNTSNWMVGDDCMAKYWEDGKYYNANITAVTDRTCVVKFKGYGNIEEVLKVDCLPLTGHQTAKKTHTGPMEFRRNTRTYRRQ